MTCDGAGGLGACPPRTREVLARHFESRGMSESRGALLALVAPDVVMKSRRTRQRFVARLEHNIRDALDRAGVAFALRDLGTRFFVQTPAVDAAASVLRHVFGLATICPVEAVCEPDPARIAELGGRIFAAQVAGKRFAVRAKRLAQHPFQGRDVEVALGAALAAHGRVDLSAPEVTVWVELTAEAAYLYSQRLAGAGGVPAGVQGRAVALISGGFDSPVAAWRMLRRGAELHFLHCSLGGRAHERILLQVVKLLFELWGHGTRPRLHLLDFRPLVAEVKRRVRKPYWQLVLKVLFYRAGAAIARFERADALITGEALGQVSSQTLANLATLDRFAEVPVLRPLLGFDKAEIVAEARAIGTAALSERMPELCSLTGSRPSVGARMCQLAAEVGKIDEALLCAAIDGRRTLDVATLAPEDLREPYLFVDHIDSNAVVIDCRSPHEFARWHVPEAINIPAGELLERWRDLDRLKRYILYCTFGTQAPLLAELMQQGGFEAYAFRGGVAALRREVEAAWARAFAGL